MNYQQLIDEACKKMEENLEDFQVKLEGTFNSDTSTVNIKARVPDSDEILDKHLDIFYDILPYLDMETKGKLYHFEFFTFSEEGEEHRIEMETDMSLIPDTGGVTKKDWDDYVNQLTYIIDGKSESLVAPDMFLEE